MLEHYRQILWLVLTRPEIVYSLRDAVSCRCFKAERPLTFLLAADVAHLDCLIFAFLAGTGTNLQAEFLTDRTRAALRKHTLIHKG